MWVYVLTYMTNSSPDEILGVYTTKNEAVEELLIRANFREKNGVLTQYKYYTDEYPSLDYLRNMVKDEMILDDCGDKYEIQKVPLDEKSKERLVAGE